MASGKSTIGSLLSQVLNFKFIDLDAHIETSEGMTITQLFKTKGELYFRKQESHYLRALLEGNDTTIIALGGGTPCYANNMNAILNSKSTVSIYLQYSIPKLSERLLVERAQRPIISHINTSEMMTEFIGKHLFERRQYYSQANYTIQCDDLTKEEIVEQIVLQLI